MLFHHGDDLRYRELFFELDDLAHSCAFDLGALARHDREGRRGVGLEWFDEPVGVNWYVAEWCGDGGELTTC